MGLLNSIQLSERTLISVFRTAIYGAVAAAFGLTHNEATPLLDGVILGATTADFLTWLLRSLMLLPENVSHGVYDGAVNLLFACFFFHIASFTINDDGTEIMFTFVAFMLVLGAKIGYYGLQTVARLARE